MKDSLSAMPVPIAVGRVACLGARENGSTVATQAWDVLEAALCCGSGTAIAESQRTLIVLSEDICDRLSLKTSGD
jgi:hypothetical protein